MNTITRQVDELPDADERSTAGAKAVREFEAIRAEAIALRRVFDREGEPERSVLLLRMTAQMIADDLRVGRYGPSRKQ